MKRGLLVILLLISFLIVLVITVSGGMFSNAEFIGVSWYREESNVLSHTHSLSTTDSSDTAKRGYCGNTITEIIIGENKYSFWGGKSVGLTDQLIRLEYKPENVCNCIAEYIVNTEFGSGYEINLTEGFVRNSDGQAQLSKNELEVISEIIHWAEKEMPDINSEEWLNYD